MPSVTRISGDASADERRERLQAIVVDEVVLARDAVEPMASPVIAPGGRAFPVPATPSGMEEHADPVLAFGAWATGPRR